MIKNYFKIAYRNFFRTKLYSSINLLGLAIGLSACIFIALWVSDEISYDSFNKYADRIYRVEQKYFTDEGIAQWPITGGPFATTLKDEYPEIENYVRFWKKEYSVQDQQKVLYEQLLFAVDNSIFDVFDYHLEKGDENKALIEPKTVVLTSELAYKYFGTDDVIGKPITFLRGGELEDFKVTGILAPVPANSHIQFEMLFSISTYFEFEFFDSWDGNYLYTYALLTEGVSISELESKFSPFMEKYKRAGFEEFLKPGAPIDDFVQLKLRNITSIHLNPGPEWEIGPQGSKASVYIFSTVAILILIIASINFMNLSTARANRRAKEVGLRKTIGANMYQLFKQFLSESISISLIAMFIAIAIVWLFLPYFSQLSGKEFSVESFFGLNNILILLGITIFTGLLSGLYPAFYLTSFRPAEVLKGVLKNSGKSVFRKYLVAIQFVISIGLIISTLTINEQMKYVRIKSLGFDKENVIVMPVQNRSMSENIQLFKNSLLQHSRITDLSISSNAPTELYYSDKEFVFEETDKSFMFIYIGVGFDFIDTYKINLFAGRNFSRNYGTDTTGTIILNEAAVTKIGISPDDIVGKILNGNKVIGVVKNFHFKSLHKQVEPLVLVLNHQNAQVISARITPGEVEDPLNYIKTQFEASYPGLPFRYAFLDDNLNMQYRSDEKMANIFMVFSVLSIIIACLGLFGLAAFTAEERTKEIGVRKTLGASIMSIILLLIKDFSKWILVANLFAWPITYYFMDMWLQDFAYKTEISIWTFTISGLLVLFIAVTTVAYQSVRASIANPVDSLKYE